MVKKKEEKPNYVIGVDPGVDNLGWCITNIDGSLAMSGLVTKTLADVKSPNDIAMFHKNMDHLVAVLNTARMMKPDFIMERYMPRGMRRGNQVERINIVIGYLIGRISYNELYMVPASQWKQRREAEYTTVINKTIPDHIVDTYTMTLYYLEKIKGLITTREVKRHMRNVRETDWGWKKTKGVWIKGD